MLLVVLDYLMPVPAVSFYKTSLLISDDGNATILVLFLSHLLSGVNIVLSLINIVTCETGICWWLLQLTFITF